MVNERSPLRIADLVVEYRTGSDTLRVLDGHTTEVNPGSLALLMGPSGSGKTTLLSTLAAILRPTSGSIAHHDIEITTLTGRHLTAYRRYGVGIAFQAFNLVPSLTSAQLRLLARLGQCRRRRCLRRGCEFRRNSPTRS